MLLLLALVNLFARSGPVLGDSLESRNEPVSCDDINRCRTLFSIISGCLATIFACTWVSAHPNVPPPDQGKIALSWRRFCMMLVAVVAPELMVGLATRQFLDARRFSKEHGVSITHGFFFSMGGFVSRSGHHPIATEEQLCLHPEYLTGIESIRVEDIEDKSKGDSLSKGVAVFQGLWFAVQCLARVQQHLPLAELEVATLAFQFANVFIWLLWWHKPLAVEQPILLGPADEGVARAERGHRTSHTTWLETVAKAFDHILTGNYPDFAPESSTSVPTFWPRWRPKKQLEVPLRPRNFILIQSLIGTIFGAIHCVAWNTTFPSVPEKLMWRSCTLMICVFPFVLTMYGTLAKFFIGTDFFSRLGLGDWSQPTFSVVYLTTFNMAIIANVCARLVLVVLPFTTLRALPPDAFVDVNWSRYIPHF